MLVFAFIVAAMALIEQLLAEGQQLPRGASQFNTLLVGFRQTPGQLRGGQDKPQYNCLGFVAA
jgi:hypothetical protein